MSTTRKTLMSILADGPVPMEEVFKRLKRSGRLGFGVEPEDVINAALREGSVRLEDWPGDVWLSRLGLFVQLERGNDWGSQYLAYKARDDLGFSDRRQAIQAEPGQKIEVKWPNGEITTESIVFGASTAHGDVVWGTGAIQQVVSEIPGITPDVNGIRPWIPLDAEGLKVREDAFSTVMDKKSK